MPTPKDNTHSLQPFVLAYFSTSHGFGSLARRTCSQQIVHTIWYTCSLQEHGRVQAQLIAVGGAQAARAA
jgi:hypothetical protein